MVCGVCNLELAESSFDDHRYSEHIGLARPYGMSQVRSKYVVVVGLHILTEMSVCRNSQMQKKGGS